MMQAGAELGVPHGQTIAAYAVGDAHTNLFNPFWRSLCSPSRACAPATCSATPSR